MGNELFYVDKDGSKQDRSIWEDLLGDDVLPTDLPTADEGAEAVAQAEDDEAVVDMSMRLFECADRTHSGLLVSLWLDQAAAEQLAVEGGEDPSQLHITLSYCGDVAELGEAGVLEAVNLIKAIAARTPGPIVGRVGGVGRFLPSPQSDGRAPIYAVADVPGLSTLQADIARALTNAGIVPRGDHGWSPHITLRYAEPDDLTLPILEEIPLTFDAITISAKDEQFHVPLQMAAIELADVPAKRRRRPTYWAGMKLSRTPTVFEASVLSLSDVPDVFAVMCGEVVESLAASRRDVVLLSDAAGGFAIYETIRAFQLRMARYGAFESDRELVRQGVDMAVVSAEDPARVGCDVAVEQSRHLMNAATLLSDKLTSDWTATIRQLQHRVDRAQRHDLDAAKATVARLALLRLNDGLSNAVGRIAQQAFSFGRRFSMSSYVANKRQITSLSADVDPDLIDYVVQTAIHDTHLCEQCEKLDGQVFEFGSDEQSEAEPPYYLCEGGERCRCMQIMVVGDWRDKATVRDAVGSDRLQAATERQAEALIKQRQRLQAEDDDTL